MHLVGPVMHLVGLAILAKFHGFFEVFLGNMW